MDRRQVDLAIIQEQIQQLQQMLETAQHPGPDISPGKDPWDFDMEEASIVADQAPPLAQELNPELLLAVKEFF